MEHLILGVRQAIRSESWYAAVALALALPDTCGSIEDPGRGKSRKRYVAWADAYVAKHFTLDSPPTNFLTGAELYNLRCSFLHEGEFEVSSDPPSPDPDPSMAMFSVLNRVNLVVSDYEVITSRNLTNTDPAQPRWNICHVGVETLCEAVCKGVEEWLPIARANPNWAAALAGLARIERWGDGGRTLL